MTKVTVRLPGQEPLSLVAGAFCSPCEAERLQAQTAAVQKTYQNPSGDPEPDAAEATANEARWTGELGYEGRFTGDGRYIAPGALRWDAASLPVPLRWTPTDVGRHGGAVVVGLIESIELVDGRVLASGFIDVSTEYGLKAYEGLDSGLLKGVSLDLDDVSFEVRVRKEVYDAVMAEVEGLMEVLDGGDAPAPEAKVADENGYVKVYEESSGDEVVYVTDALVRAATIVDIPAFKDAYIALVASGEVFELPKVAEDTIVSIAASAAPLQPPALWFENPNLSGPTPLTYTDDGRVFGHIALWGTCHTGFANTCVTPPQSRTNYAMFRTGALLTAEGTEIAVGKITMDTGHAGTRLTAGAAMAHYDNTGTAVADVSAGEDSYGIWVSGATRPGLEPSQLRALRAAPMSGDWRQLGGQLELMAILAVNTPGFPVPRTQALVASGRTSTLIVPAPSATTSADVDAQDDSTPRFEAVDKFIEKAARLRREGWAKIVREG